jgi:solute carrier family 25 protein 42
MYHGLTPTLLGIMPYAGTSFCVYGTLKRSIMALENLKSEKEIPKYQLLAAGGFSGIVAQSATYPLDILRRRMQVRSGEYKNIVDAAKHIYLMEGWRAFYKGLSMNWIKGPIAVGVSFTVNDSMKHRIREYHFDALKSVDIVKRAGTEPHLTILESLLAGGFAGAAAKFFTIPMERLKILYQVNPERHFTIRKAMKSARIIRGRSGVLALWRGSGITMMRVVPYAAITYTTYDVVKYHTPRLLFASERDPFTTFAAGAIAGVVATTITYPFDVLRVRMAAHWSPEPKYASTMAGLRKTIEQEGFRSLVQGLRPALVGIAPFVGINFAVYESCKPWLGKDPRFDKRVALGAASAIIAQSLTYPLHIISRRLQVHDVLTHGGPLYGSVANALQHIYRTEGFFHGLYKGVRLTWMLGPLAVGLSFSINDYMRDGFLQYKSNVHDDYQLLIATLLRRQKNGLKDP